MMIKQFQRYIIFPWAGFVLLIVACTHTDEIVYDQINAEGTTLSENEIFALAAPAYAQLRNLLFDWNGYFSSQEECSDILVTTERGDWIGIPVMHMHLWDPKQSHIARLWSNCYNGIDLANRSMFLFETDLNLDNDCRERIIAELKIVRAFYYYILCDNFGNVPLITRYNTDVDFLPVQSTRQQVYDFITAEIKSNIELLSEENTPFYYGRFNKWAAHALLAKIYLNAEIYTGNVEWNNCYEQCDRLLNSGKYALESTYSDIFRSANENSPEIVFAIPFDNKTDWEYGWFYLPWISLHPQNQYTYNLEVQPWGSTMAIPQFIDTYDTLDHRLNDTWIMGQQFSSSGDTLFCTMSPKYKNKPLAFINFLSRTYSPAEWEGYRIGKFEIPIGTRWMGLANDFPLIRYADIYMMKAECLLRKGQADDAALLVTEVRKRNFDLVSDAVVTGNELTGGSLYNYGRMKKGILTVSEGGGSDIPYGRFLDELGWEFANEAHRRQDLIRFGVFTSKSWLSHEPNGEYRVLFPIPDEAIGKNPNLKQNTGYEQD
jgi:hypothetical protein